MSSVYFVECADAKAVKIGWARDVGKRVNQHQCGCPLILNLIETFPGGVELEQRIHLALTGHHIRSEWVEADAALLFLDEARAVGIETAIATRLDEIARNREVVNADAAAALAEFDRLHPDRPKRRGALEFFLTAMQDKATRDATLVALGGRKAA